MASTTGLITVSNFRNLGEDDGPVYHELRHGEVVPVTRPKLKHIRIQKRIERILEQMAGDLGTVVMELSFRPLPEYEIRVADVAFVSKARWESGDPEDNLGGSPELVVEVLSPSNTAGEIFDKERLCLETGAREFWVVDPNLRQVKVSTPDGKTIAYRSGEEIPLRLFGETRVTVDSIFG